MRDINRQQRSEHVNADFSEEKAASACLALFGDLLKARAP